MGRSPLIPALPLEDLGGMESDMVRFALAAMRTIDGREAGLEAGDYLSGKS